MATTRRLLELVRTVAKDESLRVRGKEAWQRDCLSSEAGGVCLLNSTRFSARLAPLSDILLCVIWEEG